MENQVKTINCDDLEVMIFMEGKFDNKHSFYHPAISLIYIKQGVLHLEIDGHVTNIERGNFVLLNKNLFGHMEKTWSEKEQMAQMFAFIFHQKFIDKVNQKFLSSPSSLDAPSPFYVLPSNHILEGLFESIVSYVDTNKLNTDLVELKTMEAMMGVLNYHPECQPIFIKYQSSEKANLTLMMENNYKYNFPLSKLAQLSGRSLSTFCREFKAIYSTTPRKWILKRRLTEARDILENTNKKPVEFYLDLGFESLAHFSRTFKNEYGLTLTDFRKNNQILKSHLEKNK